MTNINNNNNNNNNNKKPELYNDLHPETSTKATGYKDKKTAYNTLKIIKNRSLRYQFDVINTMYNRAKYHKKQTKEMRQVMRIYKRWLKKYKERRKREERKYGWIKYEEIMEYVRKEGEKEMKIEEEIERVYKEIKKTKGKYYKLQYKKMNEKYDYWSYRINLIKIIKKNKNKIKNYKTKLILLGYKQ